MNNFSHKLLLNNTQVSKICKAFANGSSANIKFSNNQLCKIGQSGGFSGRVYFQVKSRTFRTITKNWIVFNENVLKPLTKSALIPLGSTAAASATDAAIHKNNLGY